MKQRITNVVKTFLENNHGIKKTNIEKIIFLTDTDGCYISKTSVYYSIEDQYFRYENDGVYTDRPENVINRNQLKARNLNTINSTDTVYNLPIEVYYFSCNLDHVLYQERNLEQNLKVEYAYNFADSYENKEDEFIDFIGDDSLCLALDYKETWEKIKQDNNSLLRYTNLMILFLNNIELLKDDIKEKVQTYCV